MDKLINERSRIPVSDEENYFYWWLLEAEAAGYVLSWEHQPEPFVFDSISVKKNELIGEDKKGAPKYKTKEFFYLKEQKVTADFIVVFNPFVEGYLFNVLGSDNYVDGLPFTAQLNSNGEYFCYVEVKPCFDRNNMTRLAKANRLWIYAVHKVFMNIIIPVSSVKTSGVLMVPSALFHVSWTPKRFFQQNQTNKARKISFPIRTIEEFSNQ
jgi:hypothetical protein